MKRVLSLLMCLVMCVTVFTTTITEVKALGATNEIFSVKSTGFENDTVTYTVSVAPNQKKIVGAVIKVEFDENILAVSEASGAAGKFVNGEFALNINGIYEKGVTYDDNGVYSFAYLNPNGFTTGDKETAFIDIILTAVGDARPITDVKIYCEEYITEDENNDNDIRKGDGKQLVYEDSFFTLSAATNKEVTSAENSLHFFWNGVKGADHYNIYRREAAGEWEKLLEVPGDVTDYVDTSITKGVEYYYTVSSENEFGEREKDETGLPGMYFGTITEINVEEITEKGLKVTWGALNGAEKYDVFRKAEGEDKWLKIGTTTETFYESTNLTSGTVYYYTVKAIQGKYLAEASVEPASSVYVSVPTVNYAEINYNDIVINWSVIKGATGYKVFRKGPADADFVQVTDVIEGNAYTDTNVQTSKTYLYKIQAVSGDVESAIGASSYSVVKLPITGKVTATLGVKKVTVSWEKVDLAEEYIIYRNSQPIATVDASKDKFEDKSVQSGETYSYAVATSANGMVTQKSVVSNEVYYLDSPVVEFVENGSEGMEIVFNKVKGAELYKIYRKEVGGEFKLIGEAGADSTVYVDKTAVSGIQYIYGVCAVYGETVTPMCESKVSCRLSQPEVTSLTSAYGGVTIKWAAVAGAEQYVIWYKAPGYDWAVLKTVDAKTLSYVHKTPKSARNNFYAIQAVCGDIESTMGQEVIYYFAAPEINYIENASKNVTLRWKEVDGAEIYRVYRRLKGEKSWSKIGDTESTSYKDSNVKSGKDYEYTVKAYDGYEWSPYNKNGWGIRFLSTPTLSSAKNAYGGVKVTWSKVTGASKYVVYRKKSGDDEWTKIKTVTSTSYTDTSAKSNTKYYYTVKAYYSGSYSYYNTKGVACSYLAAPVVKTSNTTSGVKVSWGKVGGAKKYIVYRKAGSAKSWTKIATTTSTSYTDKNVKNKTTYTYMVKAQKDSLVSAYNTSGVKIVFLKAPVLKTPVSSKSGVTVKWEKVSGVSGYYVYRKTGSGSYEKIAKVSGASKVSYVDKTAKKGKTYTYTVKAYYSSYTSANRSGKTIKDKY
ncbi:MAG: hypothetical protein E7533_04905 [Ruminococcaceae bacterium]|nr:hypothetical protein [Oscillospiraceae bacterium]